MTRWCRSPWRRHRRGEEIQAILAAAGIDSELQPEDEDDALERARAGVSLEAAQEAIEAMTEPDDPSPTRRSGRVADELEPGRADAGPG